jgi:hypothetical protein
MTTISEFLDDKEILGPWFSGVSWNGWKAVLKAMYGLPMSAKEIRFFQSIAGGRDPPKKPVKEAWFCCGRGAGKDSIASAIIAHAAAMFDQQNILRPGEKAMVACLAVDREQARIVLDYTRGYFAEGEFLHDLIETENAMGFDLTNGVRIAIFTNSYRSVRGPSMKICVLDEVAFWHSENSAKPDEETYRALRPGLARVPGSMLIGISSPYRKSGLLYNKWKQFYGRNDENVLVIQAPSRTLNPTINQAEIDRDMEDDQASARAEWNAEWRDDIAGWLEQELINAAVDRNVTVRPPLRRYAYRSGCDPSGGAKDSFTLAIAHTDETGISVLDCVVEIKAPFNPTAATEQLAGTLKQYKLNETIGDKYAAAWVTDAFAKCGIKYRHSERDRSAIYMDTMPLFTSGRVRLLDNKKLISQFASLERKTGPLGRDRVDHGPNGHDDVANAAALALISCRKGSLIIERSNRPYHPYYHSPRPVYF